jgi:hypothetical protein
LKKDPSILTAMLSSGVVEASSIGMDFGNKDLPHFDDDLELECKPASL